MTVADHEKTFTEWAAEKSRIIHQSQEAEIQLSELEKIRVLRERARDIVNEVLAATQREVVAAVEDLVSLALLAVYDNELSFKLEMDVARNSAQATPFIVENGQRLNPRNETGGGPVDVSSLAMRLALWALSTPRPSPVFILDEPAKFIDRARQGRFGELLRSLHEMLGIQFIVVSHDTGIIECADRSWTITKQNGISQAQLNEERKEEACPKRKS